LLYVPAVDGNGLQYPKMDILSRSEDPRISRQSRSGAFHHQRQYWDLLANRQLEWAFVERQDLPVGRSGTFGKENDGASLAQVSRAPQHSYGTLTAIESLNGHVPRHAGHPT
jgi:hypothetical protein